MEEFWHMVVGFSDTLTAFRKLLPERQLFSQKKCLTPHTMPKMPLEMYKCFIHYRQSSLMTNYYWGTVFQHHGSKNIPYFWIRRKQIYRPLNFCCTWRLYRKELLIRWHHLDYNISIRSRRINGKKTMKSQSCWWKSLKESAESLLTKRWWEILVCFCKKGNSTFKSTTVCLFRNETVCCRYLDLVRHA